MVGTIEQRRIKIAQTTKLITKSNVPAILQMVKEHAAGKKEQLFSPKTEAELLSFFVSIARAYTELYPESPSFFGKLTSHRASQSSCKRIIALDNSAFPQRAFQDILNIIKDDLGHTSSLAQSLFFALHCYLRALDHAEQSELLLSPKISATPYCMPDAIAFYARCSVFAATLCPPSPESTAQKQKLKPHSITFNPAFNPNQDREESDTKEYIFTANN